MRHPFSPSLTLLRTSDALVNDLGRRRRRPNLTSDAAPPPHGNGNAERGHARLLVSLPAAAIIDATTVSLARSPTPALNGRDRIGIWAADANDDDNSCEEVHKR